MFFATSRALSKLPSSQRGVKTLISNINQKLVKAQYAVRGELVLKAAEYQLMLQNGDHNLPFDELVFCNIGNPQELKQQPISFFREVFEYFFLVFFTE